MVYRYRRRTYRRRRPSYFKRRIIRKKRLNKGLWSRKPKMEIKHIDAEGTFNTSNALGNTVITQVTPGTIPIGVLQNNATGRWVKSRILTFECNWHVDFSGDPAVRLVPFRVVICSPRIDTDLFEGYFSDPFSFFGGSSIDPSICNVYHDFIYPVTNPFWIPGGASNTPSQASNPYCIGKIKKYIKFPRKIQLANNGLFTDSKDKCYIITRTLLATDPVNPTAMFTGWRSKLSFIDI